MRRFRGPHWVALMTLALMAWVGWMVLERDLSEVASDDQLGELFVARRSGVMVESQGVVVKLLSDDLQGSRHQRFIVRLSPGNTVLISHNIDLAPRVEGVEVGDIVAFRGQYEWNDRGGVIHWTHHDPDGRRPGGWIQHGGRQFR